MVEVFLFVLVGLVVGFFLALDKQQNTEIYQTDFFNFIMHSY